jgi:integral membrane protein
VTAYVVGIFAVFVVGGWIGKLMTEADSPWQTFGEYTAAASPVHGFLYMLLLIFIAVLSRRAQWSLGFTLTTMLLGTVPFLSFYAERRATARTRATTAATG